MEDNIFVDTEGRTVLENDADRLGNTQKYKKLLPEYQLHVEEVGFNTNTKKDKVLKEKNLCHRDNCPY